MIEEAIYLLITYGLFKNLFIQVISSSSDIYNFTPPRLKLLETTKSLPEPSSERLFHSIMENAGKLVSLFNQYSSQKTAFLLGEGVRVIAVIST